VLSLPPAVKLWFCPQPVDMRLGCDGLFALVRSRLQADPLSGHLFNYQTEPKLTVPGLIKRALWPQDKTDWGGGWGGQSGWAMQMGIPTTP
jgi:IS66 Orf2 like protein